MNTPSLKINVPPLQLIGKRINAASQEDLQRHGRAVLRGFKRILRDGDSIQKRWDCRKRARLEKSLENFGCETGVRKM